MKTRTKIVATTLIVTVLLMALHPVGPMGALLWPQPAPDAPQPEGAQLPLFMLLFLAEAGISAFGLGYLLFGWPTTRRILPARPRLALAAHVSASYLLVQWWPHGNLHMSVPFSFGAILAIDYAFHFPIMVASLVLLAAIARVANSRAQAPETRVASAEASSVSESA